MASQTKKPITGKDPRGSTAKAPSAPPPAAPVVQKHDHLAAPGRRRVLADTDKDPGESKKEKATGDKLVTVSIPRAFRLQVLDDQGSRTVQYEAGIADMPESHARHSYSLDNGVEIVDEDK